MASHFYVYVRSALIFRYSFSLSHPLKYIALNQIKPLNVKYIMPQQLIIWAVYMESHLKCTSHHTRQQTLNNWINLHCWCVTRANWCQFVRRVIYYWKVEANLKEKHKKFSTGPTALIFFHCFMYTICPWFSPHHKQYVVQNVSYIYGKENTFENVGSAYDEQLIGPKRNIIIWRLAMSLLIFEQLFCTHCFQVGL